MIYLEQFTFPGAEQEDWFLSEFYKYSHWQQPYPFKVLSRCDLRSFDMREITILYGGNGSGKSTALNMIGNKLGVRRESAYNRGDLQEEYLELCSFDSGDYDSKLFAVDERVQFISSDDIFKYMLDTRVRNDKYDIRSEELASAISRIKQGDFSKEELQILRYIDFETGKNVNEFQRIANIRKKSKTVSQCIRDEIGRKTQTYSNGETGFMRFAELITSDKLYLLDEPENSLSCELQMKLAKFIEQSARHCGCQFIIATHSPFILSIPGAKIYNLDSNPASVANWWELPNMQLMYGLFKEYDNEFSAAIG